MSLHLALIPARILIHMLLEHLFDGDKIAVYTAMIIFDLFLEPPEDRSICD